MTHDGEPISHNTNDDDSVDNLPQVIPKTSQEIAAGPEANADWLAAHEVVRQAVEKRVSIWNPDANLSDTTDIDERKTLVIEEEYESIVESDPVMHEKLGDNGVLLVATNIMLKEALGQMDVRDEAARRLLALRRDGGSFQDSKDLLLELVDKKIEIGTEIWSNMVDELFPEQGSVVGATDAIGTSVDRLGDADRLEQTPARLEVFEAVRKQMKYYKWGNQSAATDATLAAYQLAISFNYNSDDETQGVTNTEVFDDMCQAFGIADDQKEDFRKVLPVSFA